ncbi:MAG TPA: PEGA domain-containing protein [Gallionellaceae bacterium]|nr:PEGA domain-containing protein [Gallionellaceae bacterium]
MQTLAIRLVTTLFLSFVLFGCGDQGPRMDLEVNVTMNGKVVPHARVIADGKEMGETGEDGQFNGTTNRIPGKQMVVEVTAEAPGLEVQPWKNEFTVKLPNAGEVLKYVFDVDLQSSPYVAFSVQEKGVPLAGASVKVGGNEVGKTDDKGEFLYKYRATKKPLSFAVSKPGYSEWQKSALPEPGKKFDVALFKRVAVNIEAMKDEYGHGVGIAGIGIAVDGKKAGKTDANGVMVYSYEGEPGKKVRITYSAPGYLPAEWTVSVPLDGETPVRHYFFPVTPKPIQVAMFRFAGNTPGADLKDVLVQTQAALRTQLFKHGVFHAVPAESLEGEMKKENLTLAKMSSKGWLGTRLQQMVDMIVVGSVAQDERGFYIEAKFHSASGKLIFSQLIRASSSSDINSASKEIVENVIERFPFEGTVIGLKDDRYEVNLGEAYAISRGTEFIVLPPAGKEAGPAGARMVVKRVNDKSSLAELGDTKSGEKVLVGDRVVRHYQHAGESGGGDKSREFVALQVKGGVGKSASSLPGVNVYLNNDWVGTTGNNGRVEVTVRSGKNYNLMLYRHGYQQIAEKLRVEKSGEAKDYLMVANTALFKVESSPSNARIYVDGEDFGRTPLTGKPVGLGFHSVRLSVGENYRDWEEVVEFDKKVEDRTGARKIVLYKDYMKLGEAAEAKGDIDGAMAAYAATVKGHPDYSSAHHRLAQLYLDEKDNYDAAIREFENVLSLPENEQLLNKQFAIAYTNLGHAYYDKGNETMNGDRNAAAQYYAKAVQNLKVARQNMRFFPTDEYDEAVHDTYFYLALSYQKLYMITKRSGMLNEANLAWRDYFDFFPASLEGDEAFQKHRETAKKFWDQIKDM